VHEAKLTTFPLQLFFACHFPSVDAAAKQIELSLRQSAVDPTSAPLVTWATVAKGQHLEGHVRKVVPYGVFVAIDNSRLSGLCHISQARS